MMLFVKKMYQIKKIIGAPISKLDNLFFSLSSRNFWPPVSVMRFLIFEFQVNLTRWNFPVYFPSRKKKKRYESACGNFSHFFCQNISDLNFEIENARTAIFYATSSPKGEYTILYGRL